MIAVLLRNVFRAGVSEPHWLGKEYNACHAFPHFLQEWRHQHRPCLLLNGSDGIILSYCLSLLLCVSLLIGETRRKHSGEFVFSLFGHYLYKSSFLHYCGEIHSIPSEKSLHLVLHCNYDPPFIEEPLHLHDNAVVFIERRHGSTHCFIAKTGFVRSRPHVVTSRIIFQRFSSGSHFAKTLSRLIVASEPHKYLELRLFVHCPFHTSFYQFLS